MPEVERRAVVFANGRIGDYERLRGLIRDDDWIICADGGAGHALKMGLSPDVLIGDFDSLDGDIVEEISRAGAEVLRVPTEKDQTDTQLALDLALSRGAREILVLGAIGDRLDHTMANILLLPKLAVHGANVTMVDEKRRWWMRRTLSE
ncbi:MAG: thiamine diphosphokinase [Actinobacteria bacterium]|nr:thiamine diphosphokinase [Actinomycetota bacterium]